MKLISLKLLHYRRFRQEEIIFKDDFSLIFGKNGAGKSSILDAIGYALFGPNSKDFVRVNRQFLKSYFLSGREPSKIELNFQYGFDNYRIVRIIDSGTKKFANEFIPEMKDSLFGPNNIEVIGGDEITNFVSNLVGIDRNTFLKSVFTKQKDLEVLSGTSMQRKQLINSILGLDKLENIILNFKNEEKEKKFELEIYKKKVAEFDIEDLKKKKNELNIKLKEVVEKIENEEKILKTLNDNFFEIKKNFDTKDKKRNDFLAFDNQIKTNNELILNYQNQNEKLKIDLIELEKKEKYLEDNKKIPENEKLLNEKLKIEEKNKNKFEELIKLKKNLLDYDVLLKDLNKKLFEFGEFKFDEQIKILEKYINEIEINNKKNYEEKSEFDTKRNLLLKEYKEIEIELNSIKNLENKADCPTCKRPLKEYFPHLIELYKEKLSSKIIEGKKLKQALEKINIIILENDKKIQIHKDNIANLRQKEKETIKLLEQKNQLEKNIGEYNEKIQNIGEINFRQEEFNKLKKDYEEAKKNYLNYIKIQGEINNKSKILGGLKDNSLKVEELNSKIININLELEKLDFKQEEYLQIKQDYFELNNKIKLKNEQKNFINKDKLNFEFDLKNLENKEFDLEKDNEKIKELVLKTSNLGLKKQILSDYIIYLLNYLKPNIEDLASEYFGIITDYKYSSISLDEDYNILLDYKNIDLYSGGEIDLANLCLRLSLGQNLTSAKGSPINFLILDEILASQDKDRQQNILINLKKIEHKFSQIILISHLDEIKDFSTNLIEIKSLNKQESIIVYH